MITINEFLSKFENVKTISSGIKWSAKCPSHDDMSNSLGITMQNDKIGFKCFAGKCNGYQILEAVGLTMQDVKGDDYKPKTKKEFSEAINTKINEIVAKKTTKKTHYKAKDHEKISLIDIANAKGLDVKDIKKYGVKQASSYVFIPYFKADGSQSLRNRLRIALEAKDGSRWTTGDEDIVPYFLDRMKKEDLIIVEGESDCWTLGKYDFNVIGIPSVEMVKCLKAEMLEGINTLYVVKENDVAGDKFVLNIKNSFPDKKIKVINIPQEFNDTNDLYRAKKENFAVAFKTLMNKANLDIVKREKEKENDIIINHTDDAILIKTVHGQDAIFHVYSNGIFAEREIKDKETGRTYPVTNKICSTPLIIESLIEDMYSEESYVKLTWGKKSKLVPTHWLYSKNMQNLTRIGIKVLSKNANTLSEYALESLEYAEVLTTSTRNGWKDSQIVIGNSLITKEGIEKMERNKDSVIVGSSGSFEKWKEAVNPFFEDPQMQAIAGCSTVALLLDVLGLPSFTMHVYGESSCGKSLASKISASIWGNPHTMLKDWRGTPVSHELYFHKMKNLPCFLEECQENMMNVEESLYQFGNNCGKTRGTIKDGQVDLAEGKDWRTTMISTGEVRVTDSTVQGGLFARVFEMKKKLFQIAGDDLLFVKLDRTFEKNYGHGGIKISQYILENKEKLIDTYDHMYKKISPKLNNAIAGSDIKRRVVKHIIAILLGASINEEVLGVPFDKKAVFTELELLITNMPETSISHRLHSFITDFFIQNSEHFLHRASGVFVAKENQKDIYGFSFDDTGVIYFIQQPLKDAMIKAGFSWSMLQSLQDAGLLDHNTNRITKSIKTAQIAELLPLNQGKKPTLSIRCIGLKTLKDSDTNFENE